VPGITRAQYGAPAPMHKCTVWALAVDEALEKVGHQKRWGTSPAIPTLRSMLGDTCFFWSGMIPAKAMREPSTRTEFLVYAKREPEREAHFMSMAESWLRLANQAERIQALTDHARPIIPRNPNLDVSQSSKESIGGGDSYFAQKAPVTE
jgi:hypothetical protein